MQWLSTHMSAMEAKMFSVWSVRWLYHEYEASSTQQSDNREVGQFSTSQYEARREVNAVN
jgi:hypothetical protein